MEYLIAFILLLLLISFMGTACYEYYDQTHISIRYNKNSPSCPASIVPTVHTGYQYPSKEQYVEAKDCPLSKDNIRRCYKESYDNNRNPIIGIIHPPRAGPLHRNHNVKNKIDPSYTIIHQNEPFLEHKNSHF